MTKSKQQGQDPAVKAQRRKLAEKRSPKSTRNRPWSLPKRGKAASQGRRLSTTVRGSAAPTPGGRILPAGGGRGLITVLMSAYKSARWVEAAARSVLEQPLPWGWRVELLIGVDQCQETEVAVRRAFASDPRVAAFRMAKNVGTYQTLNALLEHARGELVAVMDSDDISTPGRLGKAIDHLVRHPRVGIVGGPYLNVGPDMKPMPGVEPTREICHGAMTARRSVYNRLGGYKPWRCGADLDFFVRARKLGLQIDLLPEVALRRRVHPSSLCNAPTTGRESPARKKAYAEIEAERARPRATVVKRSSPAHAKLFDLRPRFERGVGVVMATIPEREESARAVVEGLLKQGVDALVIHFNGHRRVPGWARRPKIQARLHPPGTGPITRFSELPDCRYVLSVDDDIVYPSSYVAATIRHLRRLGEGTAVSYHGSWWPAAALRSGGWRYQDRSAIRYSEGSSADRTIMYGGCGVAGFHARDLWHLDADAAPSLFAMEDDAWISGALSRTGVRLVRPACSEGWIRPVVNRDTGLYLKAKRDGFKRRDAAIAQARAMGAWPRFPLGGQKARSRPPTKEATTSFDEVTYWRNRYKETGSSIRTVGRRDASEATNQQEYAQAMRQLVEAARSDLGALDRISVLDVGYGQAHYAKALAKAGVVDYLGIDLVGAVRPPELVAKGFEFRRIDIGAAPVRLGRKFDLVIVLDVIYHLVDEQKFRTALANIKAHARGLVYVTSTFRPGSSVAHVRHRPVAAFRPLGELLGPPQRWRDNKIARFRAGGQKQ